MSRRNVLLGLVASAAAAGLFAACGGDDAPASDAGPAGPDPSSGSTTSTASTAKPLPPGEAKGQALRAKATANPIGAGAALTPFALASYRRMAAGTTNVVYSPASVAYALTMARNGASGQTALEMDKVLAITSLEERNDVLNAIDTVLELRSGTRQRGFNSTDEVSLSLANALWGQAGTTFLPAFLDTLSASYGAPMHVVDYKTNAEGARQAINAWVSERTKTRIPDLIGPGALNALTRLVLTNAIYLKASWDIQFSEGATADGPFTTLDGKTVTAKLMNQSENLAYAQGDGWQAVELPYVGRELAMTLIVPDAGRFSQVEASVDFGAVTAALKPRQVGLTMPRWTFRTQAQLSGVLRAMGMPAAFDEGGADFSLMTREERLVIDEVIHEAFIAVDETGTEAAAATAIVMRVASAPPTPTPLKIDRPFLFAIRDLPTQTLLFLGRVADPTAE